LDLSPLSAGNILGCQRMGNSPSRPGARKLFVCLFALNNLNLVYKKMGGALSCRHLLTRPPPQGGPSGKASGAWALRGEGLALAEDVAVVPLGDGDGGHAPQGGGEGEPLVDVEGVGPVQ